jgi:hypothetical protein
MLEQTVDDFIQCTFTPNTDDKTGTAAKRFAREVKCMPASSGQARDNASSTVLQAPEHARPHSSSTAVCCTWIDNGKDFCGKRH